MIAGTKPGDRPMTTLEALLLFVGSPLIAWFLTRVSLPRSQR